MPTFMVGNTINIELQIFLRCENAKAIKPNPNRAKFVGSGIDTRTLSS